ncbi:MAG: VOC family protein [Acidobacteria bacterium]|nr:VOC family protein [Acidobacteriota bacterium]
MQDLLFVKNLELMAAFYAQALGAEAIRDLKLHPIPPSIAATIEIASPPVPREDTPIKLIFAVPDIDAARRNLEQLGAEILVRPWGSIDAVDPEGNIFSLTIDEFAAKP